MPAKGKPKVSDRQRAEIALRRSQGATHGQIAEELDLHQMTVKKQALDPRTLSIVHELKAAHHAELKALYKKGLKALDELLASSDPGLRLRAVLALVAVLSAGEASTVRVFTSAPVRSAESV